MICDDLYFALGFTAIAEREGIACQQVTTEHYASIVGFKGTVLIDLVSWCKSGSIEYTSQAWPGKYPPDAGFIISCTGQKNILDLICDGCFKIERKSTPGEISRLFSADSLPQSQYQYKPLTLRENEILAMRLSGMSTRKIALTLRIHVKTVYAHLYNILMKSGCKSLIGFYALALPLSEMICRFNAGQNGE
ncbi:helix-turn-helix domain-containing protein [Pantoea sp. NSTU24]|uniref:helix-turn-helix domain-containing protein n=1 Tax=Pantoea sp. NSTU24 TaxID=3391144 RepID=UPI003CFF6C50